MWREGQEEENEEGWSSRSVEMILDSQGRKREMIHQHPKCGRSEEGELTWRAGGLVETRR